MNRRHTREPACSYCDDSQTVTAFEAPEPGALAIRLLRLPCPKCSGGERYPNHRRAA